MSLVDLAHWARLSPLLDELLELGADGRAARLAELGRSDPALAAELQAFIDDAARAEAAGFLKGRADPAEGAAGDEATLAGQRIGPYVLERPIGQGGTGAVWRARRADGRYEGAVAVKLLHLSLMGRAGALRFEQEGAILARLSHPNIARLIDAGIAANGQPYLVLELVEGEPLDRHCDQHRLGIDARIERFQEVLGAVAHAHGHLVIHRDIKPSNILVTDEGSVKLLDFGIAKLLRIGEENSRVSEWTQVGGRALTPDYAAPEQLRGDDVTTATDVYALGVLLFELLTGRHPTKAVAGDGAAGRARTPVDAEAVRLSAAVSGNAPGAALSGGAQRASADALARIAIERGTTLAALRRRLRGDLENVVAKALRRVPEERYRTVDAFADDLRRALAGQPVSARPDSLAYRTARFVGRHRVAVAAGVLGLAAVLAGIVGTLSQAERARLEGARATREAEAARQERDLALEQERLLRGTNEFMQLLMRDAAGGDAGSIRRQLDRAAELISRTRFEQPVVKVALLRQTAARYAELGDMGAGIALMREAIAATVGTELDAPNSGVAVNLACSLARFLENMGDAKAALAELDAADRRIAAGAVLSVPSHVACRLPRSYAEAALGHYAAAVATARDALQRLTAAGVTEGEQHRVVRSTLSQMLLAAARHAEAMAIARPLLEESVAGQGRQSVAVLRRSSVVTRLTRLGGQPLAALQLSTADRADAARTVGGGALGDAEIALEHGRVLLELARYREAAAVLAESAANATETGRLGIAREAGMAEIEAWLLAGQLTEAKERHARLRPDGEGGAQRGVPEQIEMLRIDAVLGVALHDREGTMRALDEAGRLVDAQHEADDPARFRLALARGEALLAFGLAPDTTIADAALSAARRRALADAPSSDVGRALLLRAKIHAAAGRAEPARVDAAAALAELDPTLGPAHPQSREAANIH